MFDLAVRAHSGPWGVAASRERSSGRALCASAHHGRVAAGSRPERSRPCPPAGRAASRTRVTSRLDPRSRSLPQPVPPSTLGSTPLSTSHAPVPLTTRVAIATSADATRDQSGVVHSHPPVRLHADCAESRPGAVKGPPRLGLRPPLTTPVYERPSPNTEQADLARSERAAYWSFLRSPLLLLSYECGSDRLYRLTDAEVAVGHELGGTFESFVCATETRLREALSAALGTDAGREATAEALAYAWAHWDRVSAMENPAGYLYLLGRRRGRRMPGRKSC